MQLQRSEETMQERQEEVWGNFLGVKSSVHTNSFGRTTLDMRSYFEQMN